MKGLKKIIVIAILSVMMALCSFGAITAFAEDSISTTRQVNVYADQVETTIGQKERLSFYAEGYANVAGFHFIIVLPSNVTFSSFEIAEGFEEANYQYSINANEISIICNSANQTYASTTDLFYIDVIAREEGYGEAWYRNYMMTDFDANDIYCMAYSVGISVLGEGQENAIRGDVNGDESVDVQDLMLMQRYILGSLGDEANFSTTAGDVDGDYDIDLIDCQQVQRYLVGKISFDELQNLSNGSGQGGNTPNPDIPNNYVVTYDVMQGSTNLIQALSVDFRDLKAEFRYQGETLFGTLISLQMIDEEYNEDTAVFIPHDSAMIYMFVMGDEKTVKLDGVYDLNKQVEKDPANFDKTLQGEYVVSNGSQDLGYIKVGENGVFTGFANFNMGGVYYSLNVNGVITEEEGTTYAYVFGMEDKEIRIDPVSRVIVPLENGEVVGASVHFDIYYILENGNSIYEESYYTMKEGEDINEVAKRLAYQHLIGGYQITNFSVNYLQDGRYSINVWVVEKGGSSGEETQGTKINLYMYVANDEHFMLQPASTLTVSSAEELLMMLDAMKEPPAEAQMEFVGIYVDSAMKMPYTEDMGLNISELYIAYSYVEGVNMLAGLGGTYLVYEQDDNGNQTKLENTTLVLTEQNQIFMLTIGEKTYRGEAIVLSKGYDENGSISYAQLTLMTANDIQIAGYLEINSKQSIFYMHGLEDYSGYETVEEFKDVAGEYVGYLSSGGMEMAKCTIILKDNGVMSLQLFNMLQLGEYEIILDMTGKATIIMTVDGAPMEAPIDIQNKAIYISMQMGGGSSDVNGGVNGDNFGEDTEEFVATIWVVSYDEKFPIYVSEDSYEALKEGLNNCFGDLNRIKVYVDRELKVELAPDTFTTVNQAFYVVINENYVENNQNGYEGSDGEVSDKVIIIK